MTGGKGESGSSVAGVDAAQAAASLDHPYSAVQPGNGGSVLCETTVNHSVIVDPSFVKLNKIKHARGCERTICFSDGCGATKLLLRHINGCNDVGCKYQDCGLGKVLLDHDSNRHHNLAGCPICKKHRALLRVHPGKAPRTMDVEKEDDAIPRRDLRIFATPGQRRKAELQGANQRAALMSIGNVSRSFKRPAASQSSQSSRASTPPVHEKRMRDDAEEAAPDQAPAIARRVQKIIARRLAAVNRRSFLAQYEHTSKCELASCPSKSCADQKLLLEHVKSCRNRECTYNRCRLTIKLLFHYEKCEPEGNQCHFCFKKAPYRGKDYFADLNTVVLRTIALHLEKDTKSLNALQQVNKRVYSFFNFSGEIKGLFPKILFQVLFVYQVGNGTICFRFLTKSAASGGFIHLITSDGASERITYSAAKKHAVEVYIRNKYTHHDAAMPPVELSPLFYDSLAHALQKYDFAHLMMKSVSINLDELNNFFLQQRKGNECLLNNMSIQFKNVKFVTRD